MVDAEAYSEDDLFAAIDAGAEDINPDDDIFEIVTEPSDFVAVRAALEGEGVKFESADIVQRPKNRVELDDRDAAKLFRLIESLEDHDDVNDVAANFDVSDEALEALAAE